MRMRALKLVSLGLALFLASCNTPTATPTATPTIVSITATLPAIETPAPTATAPQPTIEPTTINPGDAITITWRTTGGQVNLFPINPFGQMGLPYQVANNDSLVIV